MAKKDVKLTDKQLRFIQEYVIDCNATRAAKAAGYSENTAQRTGSENLSKPVIAEAIDKGLAEKAKRNQIEADWAIKELREILVDAKTGLPKFDKDGNFLGNVPDFHAAIKAIDTIAKIMGWYKVTNNNLNLIFPTGVQFILDNGPMDTPVQSTPETGGSLDVPTG